MRLGDKEDTNNVFKPLFNIEGWSIVQGKPDRNNDNICEDIDKLPWVVAQKIGPDHLYV